MCRPKKITGIFEPLRGESGHTLSVGDITHYGATRFDEMPVVPVQPRTAFRLEPETKALKLPEVKTMHEVINNG